jgi:hypothetical protein
MKALDLVSLNCEDEVSMQVRMVVAQFWEGGNAVFVWASLYERASMSKL